MVETTTRCHHGIDKECCADCAEPTKGRRSQQNGTLEITAQLAQKTGRAVLICTAGLNPKVAGWDKLNDDTYYVHIQGHPYLWAIEKILRLCPNLRIIQVIPPALTRLGPRHIALCTARGVKTQTGRWRPDIAWGKKSTLRSPTYNAQREFLLNLTGEQGKLFRELLQFKFEEARLTARYFCLKGEAYRPQRQVAEMFGLTADPSGVSNRLCSVLQYLDPSLTTGGLRAKTGAEALRRRVEAMRKGLEQKKLEKQENKRLGITELSLPAGLPPSRVVIFKKLLAAKANGKLDQLEQTHPRQYKTVVLRYGLQDGDNTFKILDDVAPTIGCNNKERARQIEKEGLELLGIGT